MPKQNVDYPEPLNTRISSELKRDLIEIDPIISDSVRMCLTEYVPIKKLMANPMFLPRVFETDQQFLEIVIDPEKGFKLIATEVEEFIFSDDQLKNLAANILLYLTSKTK